MSTTKRLVQHIFLHCDRKFLYTLKHKTRTKMFHLPLKLFERKQRNWPCFVHAAEVDCLGNETEGIWSIISVLWHVPPCHKKSFFWAISLIREKKNAHCGYKHLKQTHSLKLFTSRFVCFNIHLQKRPLITDLNLNVLLP